ncbi:MAG TPA: NADH-quinone oxidoreductase subunit N [Blastocatellia bacterium]|nr:NADH-quinone oxidoreductase subunit N [Blastocatellia bacterium]
MTPNQIGISYHAVLPETITSLAGILIMLVDAFSRKTNRRIAGGVALAGIVAAAAAVISLWGRGGETSFRGMIITDDFRLFFALISLVVAFLITLISLKWVEDEALPTGEYFALLLFATTGMLFMSAANDLVMIFLGLEITSISTYVMCGYRRNDMRSNESAMKYFILGSFSTAFLLYGIALVYGATFNPAASPRATTNLQIIQQRIASGQVFSQEMLLAGAAMMIVGFGFKVATAPFHIWSPDVYEGAPTPVTALLSTGSKASAFAAFARVFILTFAAAPIAIGATVTISADLQSTITNALAVMAILTMTLGNLVAIVQNNIKRMLAYSSIAHAGYALVGMVANDWPSVAFYLLSYAVINIGAFAVVEVIARRGDKSTDIADYRGIGFKSIGLATALSLFLLSLAGIPLTAGFMGKLLVFKAAWVVGSVNNEPLLKALVVIGVINSAISWYYYLRVIVAMFFAEPAEGFKAPAVSRSLAAALLLAVLGTFYLGILPGRVLDALERARDKIVTAAKISE